MTEAKRMDAGTTPRWSCPTPISLDGPMPDPATSPAELRRLHERVVAGWIEIEDFDPWYAAKEALFACIPLLADRIEELEKEKERLENRLSLASERIDGLRVAS